MFVYLCPFKYKQANYAGHSQLLVTLLKKKRKQIMDYLFSLVTFGFFLTVTLLYTEKKSEDRFFVLKTQAFSYVQ